MKIIRLKIRLQKLTNYRIKDFYFVLRIGFVDDEEKKREKTRLIIQKHLSKNNTEEFLDLIDK